MSTNTAPKGSFDDDGRPAKPKVMVAYIIEGMAEIGPFSKAEIEALPTVRRMPDVIWRREVTPYWWNTPDGVDRSLPMWDATRR